MRFNIFRLFLMMKRIIFSSKLSELKIAQITKYDYNNDKNLVAYS